MEQWSEGWGMFEDNCWYCKFGETESAVINTPINISIISNIYVLKYSVVWKYTYEDLKSMTRYK